jgi:excisionase family DNA binding protein
MIDTETPAPGDNPIQELQELGMTINEVATKSGLSESTIYRGIKLGHLQAYRPKGRYVVEDHPGQS